MYTQEMISKAYAGIARHGKSYGLAIPDYKRKSMIKEYYGKNVSLYSAKMRDIGGGLRKQKILSDAKNTRPNKKSSLSNISASVIISSAEKKLAPFMQFLYQEPMRQESYIGAVKSVSNYIDSKTEWHKKTRDRLNRIAWLIALNMRKLIVTGATCETYEDIAALIGGSIKDAENLRANNISAIYAHYMSIHEENLQEVRFACLNS